MREDVDAVTPIQAYIAALPFFLGRLPPISGVECRGQVRGRSAEPQDHDCNLFAEASQ
jgi:hypothetical protein